MGRATGIGGVFFRANDPAGLQAWYVEHLGLEPDADGYVVIREEPAGELVWAPFPADTGYFGPNAFMVNYRVDDLDAVLERLRRAGVRIDEQRHTDANGRFAWAWDPEGNRIELWEPAPGR